MSFQATSTFRRAASVGMLLLAIPVAVNLPLEDTVQATAPEPVIEVTQGGQPAGTLEAGDRVSVSATQGSPSGADGQFLETVWEPGTATIDVNSIDAPEGFTLEYRTGTSTWSTTQPNPTTSITGIRAVGGVTSSAFVDGVQTWETMSTGELETGGQGFTGSGGGDGWDIFYGYGRIYNIFHHNTSDLGVDCHIVETSQKCWSPGGTPGAFFLSGYTTGARSTGSIDESTGRLWALVKRNSDSAIGFACLNVTVSATVPTPCTGVGTSGFVSLGSTGLSTYNGITDAYLHGGKFWTKANDANSPMLCLDLSTAAACAGQPYSVTASGYSSPSGDYTAGRIKGFAGKVYITSGNTQFDCFDTTNLMRCAGAWPKTSGTFSNPIFAITSGANGQTIEAVCTHNNTSSCYTPAGVAFPYPSGLPSTSNAAVEGWGDNNNIGARYYYINGNSSFGCWDFTVNTAGSACAGYSQGQTQGNYVYAVTQDPNNATCLWSNADNAGNGNPRITPFNANTGTVGCTLPIPEVTFPPERTAPRLACEPVPGATAWRQFRLVLPGGAVSAANYTLEISDSSGNPVPGWSSVDLGTQGTFANGVVTLNLSSLSVASTGATPEFKVITPPGTSDATAQLLRARVTFDSAPPQLCFDLQIATLSCPSGEGIAASATPPGRSVSLVSTTLVTTSGVPSSASANYGGAMGPVTGCLGTVVGVARDAAGNPVRDVPVALKTGATTHATVLTNAAGHAVFTNVYPFLTSASALHFQASGSFLPIDPVTTVDLTALTAGSTVTGSAMTYAPTATPALPLVNLPVQTTPSTTTTVPAPTTTTPPTTTPPTTVAPPASSPRNPPPGVEPVRVADPTGEVLLPELVPGESQVLDNGVPVDVDIAVEDTTDLVMKGEDWELRLKGDCDVRLCTVTEQNAREVLELEVDGAANVNGFGFKPGTLVHIWLFSDPIYLGSLLVAEDGTFTGSVDLLDVEFGEHTLQVNGISYDDKDRTANLGVVIRPNTAVEPTAQLPATGTNTTTTVLVGLLLAALGTALVGRRRYV